MKEGRKTKELVVSGKKGKVEKCRRGANMQTKSERLYEENKGIKVSHASIISCC
jgi:hypothetical protein